MSTVESVDAASQGAVTFDTPRRIVLTAAMWAVVTAAGIAAVLVVVGPLLLQREQRRLLGQYRTEIEQASNQAFGLDGVAVPTTAPEAGAPVGIVDIADLGLRQVVVEGVGPGETRRGPGHVPGTAGPGQPGNSVVVGRRSLFGGPLGALGSLEEGDRLLVTTSQGQSVYEVERVGQRDVGEPEAAAEVYGPSDDDRLTLVTSASSSVLDDARATVVVATMDGVPFEPTPQNGRTASNDGRRGDPVVSAGLVAAVLGYAVAVAIAVVLYRTMPWRSAYLLSAPILLAGTIVLAEQVGARLPAWS